MSSTAVQPSAVAGQGSATVGQAADEPKLSPGLYIGYLAMVLGMFMAILDIQIVSSSINEIQAGLSASADEISWVQTSYLIAEVIMIPFSGYLSRLLSTRILFTISALSFTLASVGCAMSNSLESMIVMRALQGFLGGAMIPTVFATVFIMFPPRKRAVASVTIGLIATLAPTIGPTLGGYLTQWMSWHWLFLINVVPGIVVCVVVWTFLDIDKPNLGLLRGFDYIGLAAMAVFLGSLEYVIEEGPRKDWLAEPAIRNFAIACTIGGVVFFWRSITHKNPAVDLKAFANRNFAVGCAFSFTMGIGLYGLVYLLPLFLARVRGLNSLQIGEIMFVTGLAQFLIAPLAGYLARNTDPRKVLLFGLALMAASTYGMANITGDWQFNELLLPQIMRGAGLMLCMVPINAIALGTLPPQELKNASGLYNLTRNLGGAFGLAAINTVLIERNALHWNRLIEAINPGRPEVQAYIDGIATSLAERLQTDETMMAARLLGAKIQQQASIMSFADCFYLMAILFACAAAAVMLARRPIPQAGSGGGH
ncbi:DHA2 family efflux MFS transporter permease subunit [Ferrovibrio sp.]|uniref:DHA2 family efflux MFS transporter permease subunit n=1 Tax=Ferrovibrio sp. TaxID=1917215 RepID=UPI0025BCF2BE|nr:DHA2 family efflux MFS transporter permease subunit [Ferrovibrio sp.]MBX3454791.1 DHA2 family efflux MFS transporter permease subunit [Ferrovibrio sp.]